MHAAAADFNMWFSLMVPSVILWTRPSHPPARKLTELPHLPGADGFRTSQQSAPLLISAVQSATEMFPAISGDKRKNIQRKIATLISPVLSFLP
jgi:hypothetical protein